MSCVKRYGRAFKFCVAKQQTSQVYVCLHRMNWVQRVTFTTYNCELINTVKLLICVFNKDDLLIAEICEVYYHYVFYRLATRCTQKF